MKHLLLLLSCLLVFAGCRTKKYIEVPVYKTVTQSNTDTHWLTDTVSDKVFIHDSVMIKQKGDTVYVDRWHKEKQRQQAVRIVRHDSIVVDSVRVPYPIERKLTKWQRTKQYAGGISIALVCAGLVVALIYLFRKLRKMARSKLKS